MIFCIFIHLFDDILQIIGDILQRASLKSVCSIKSRRIIPNILQESKLGKRTKRCSNLLHPLSKHFFSSSLPLRLNKRFATRKSSCALPSHLATHWFLWILRRIRMARYCFRKQIVVSLNYQVRLRAYWYEQRVSWVKEGLAWGRSTWQDSVFLKKTTWWILLQNSYRSNGL